MAKKAAKGAKKKSEKKRYFLPQGLKGCSVGAPNFFIYTICCSPGTLRDSLRREVADIRADVPGGRVRRIVRRDARTLQTDRGKGGFRWRRRQQRARKRRRRRRSNRSREGLKRGPHLVWSPFFVAASSSCCGVRPASNLRGRGWRGLRRHSIPNPDASDHVPRDQAIDDLHAADHVTEHGVARIQVRLR